MADQEFLASFAVDIDENGVFRLQQILEENRDMAEELASAFDTAAESVRSFISELSADMPGLFSGNGYGIAAENMPVTAGLKVGLDFTGANSELEAFINLARKPVPLSANASGITSAARSAYNSVKQIFSSPIIIQTEVKNKGIASGTGEETPVPMSTGGRFARPTDVQVAEDGDAEYIIPVRKEDRAVPLLRQLLAELSPAARADLSLGDAALPLSGGISASMPAAAQITQNNSNVSAPVSIEVHSSGANAEQIGQSVYDTAERYLLRCMKGVFA